MTGGVWLARRITRAEQTLPRSRCSIYKAVAKLVNRPLNANLRCPSRPPAKIQRWLTSLRKVRFSITGGLGSAQLSLM